MIILQIMSGLLLRRVDGRSGDGRRWDPLYHTSIPSQYLMSCRIVVMIRHFDWKSMRYLGAGVVGEGDERDEDGNG